MERLIVALRTDFGCFAIIVAFIGAVLLLAILRLVSGAGRGSYRRRRWL